MTLFCNPQRVATYNGPAHIKQYQAQPMMQGLKCKCGLKIEHKTDQIERIGIQCTNGEVVKISMGHTKYKPKEKMTWVEFVFTLESHDDWMKFFEAVVDQPAKMTIGSFKVSAPLSNLNQLLKFVCLKGEILTCFWLYVCLAPTRIGILLLAAALPLLHSDVYQGTRQCIPLP